MTPIGCRQKCFLTLVSLTLKIISIIEMKLGHQYSSGTSVYIQLDPKWNFSYFGLMPIIIFAYCHGISEIWCLSYVLMSYPHSRLILTCIIHFCCWCFCINYYNAYLLPLSVKRTLQTLPLKRNKEEEVNQVRNSQSAL